MNFSRLALLLGLGLILASCTDGPQNSAAPQNSTPAAPEVEATNWSALEIDGRINRFDGKTVVDTSGHFLAAHNACSQEEEPGAYEVGFWNPFVGMINAAIKTPLSGTPQCFDNPGGDTMIDGNVYVTTSNGKVTLYEPQNGQVCTRIQDPVLAKNLFQSLNQALTTAGAEDCAHPI
jgi:hypothetical protein